MKKLILATWGAALAVSCSSLHRINVVPVTENRYYEIYNKDGVMSARVCVKEGTAISCKPARITVAP